MTTERFSEEDKAEAVRMVREEGATMPELVQRFGAARPSIRKWLEAAGVSATPVRRSGGSSERKLKPGQSLGNTPLALKLEENCRRRCEGRTDLLP